MFTGNRTFRKASVNSAAAALSCLALLVVLASQAKADTLTIAGVSNSVSLETASSNSVRFNGQTFDHSFTFTSVGQTFDFVFGRYSIPPTPATISFGCLDFNCLTLTGVLADPAGQLSFTGRHDGGYFGDALTMSVRWASGSGPFFFTTAEGGSGQFTIQLLNFFATNSTGTTQFYDQLARITVTQFTPAGATPVPEPVTLLLFGTGLAAVGVARGRRSRGRGRTPHAPPSE